MDFEFENVCKWAALAVVLALITVAMIAICDKHEFHGYYLYGGDIFRAVDWQPDERAFDYTPEMWHYIVENNLHLEKETK